MKISQELMDSIIQEAIKGKLTPQIVEDNSIFKLIEIAKERIGKSNVSNEDNVEFFKIPKNWAWVRLGDVCEIARGGSPRPISSYITNDKDGINWIKIGDTDKNGKYIKSTKEKIIKEGERHSRKVHVGDFLLTNSMSFGRPYILEIDGCIHDGWLVISQPIEVFEQNYLYYMLSSEFTRQQFCGLVSGAVVKNLNIDKVANSYFPVPPKEEQERIVDKLMLVEEKIKIFEKLETKLTELNEDFPEEMKNAILQAALQGKLTTHESNDSNPEELLKEIENRKNELVKRKILKEEQKYSEFEKPYLIPNNWVWTQLGKVCVYAYSGKSPVYVKVNNGNYTLGQAANQNEGIDFKLSKFSSDEHINRCKKYEFLQEKDVLLNTLGGGSVGRVGIFYNPNNYKCITDGHIFVFRTCGIVNERYLYYYMKFNQAKFEKMAGGATNQCFLKLPVVKNYPFPLPPYEEQERIVAILDEILPKCSKIV